MCSAEPLVCDRRPQARSSLPRAWPSWGSSCSCLSARSSGRCTSERRSRSPLPARLHTPRVAATIRWKPRLRGAIPWRRTLALPDRRASRPCKSLPVPIRPWQFASECTVTRILCPGLALGVDHGRPLRQGRGRQGQDRRAAQGRPLPPPHGTPRAFFFCSGSGSQTFGGRCVSVPCHGRAVNRRSAPLSEGTPLFSGSESVHSLTASASRMC